MSVTPTLTVTTEDAKNRFTPDDRVCYFDEEFYFEFLPKELFDKIFGADQIKFLNSKKEKEGKTDREEGIHQKSRKK